MEQLDEEQRRQLDDFFKLHQTRAFKMAYVMTHNRDDALELVQDSMLRLVKSYAARPAHEWKLLFYRILQNCIRDFYRRQSLKKLLFIFSSAEEPAKQSLVQMAVDEQQKNPQQQLEQSSIMDSIMSALKTLPLRQQQTFLLRAWQEFSVSETAHAMSVSEGSVKTHYSRALQKLRKLLGEPHEEL